MTVFIQGGRNFTHVNHRHLETVAVRAEGLRRANEVPTSSRLIRFTCDFHELTLLVSGVKKYWARVGECGGVNTESIAEFPGERVCTGLFADFYLLKH